MRALLVLAIACGTSAPTSDAAPIERPSQVPDRPARIEKTKSARKLPVKKKPVAKKQKRAKKPVVAKPAQTATATQKAKRDRTELYITRPADAESSPAYRYAQMPGPVCKAELAARKIPYREEVATLGVRYPVRLAGKLHGIEFRTNLKDAQRTTTPWEIVDCRLVLALDDFAKLLAAYDVIDVRHYSMYRKPSQPFPDDKIGIRHNGALAIDAARFIRKDGSYLDVDKHWNGAIDAPTCGPKAAPSPATPEALMIREILCKAMEQRIFHVALTPNYDPPHKNHFHLEITEGWKSFLLH